MTATTTQPVTAKPSGCDFSVVTLVPQGAHQEIGTLTYEDASGFWSFGPSSHAESPDEFKRAVQAEVCRLGGDIVVTELNGRGQYVRGTVLRTAR